MQPSFRLVLTTTISALDLAMISISLHFVQHLMLMVGLNLVWFTKSVAQKKEMFTVLISNRNYDSLRYWVGKLRLCNSQVKISHSFNRVCGIFFWIIQKLLSSLYKRQRTGIYNFNQFLVHDLSRIIIKRSPLPQYE